MDRGASWATVPGVAKSQAQLKRLCTHPLHHVFSLWSLKAWVLGIGLSLLSGIPNLSTVLQVS